MKNKFALLILLLVAIVFFTGCASINHTRSYNNSTGEITDTFTIKLSSQDIPPTTLTQLENAIVQDFNAYIVKVHELEGVTAKKEITNNTYSLIINFPNASALALVYDNKDIGPFTFYLANNKFGWVGEYSPFLYKYQHDSDKSLMHTIEYRWAAEHEQTYYQRYQDILSGNEANSFDLTDIDITQSFATTADRIYSNANKVKRRDGKTIHTWELNHASADFQLEIYKLIPRTSAWYVLGIMLALVLVIVLIVVSKIYQHKKIKEISITEL